MAKNNVGEWSTTAANNTDVANINIGEGCAPSNINNAIRAIMAQIKSWLGDAATKTVQTGATDAAAGRLLAVGAFGLGGTGNLFVSDANTVVVSGMYTLTSSTSNAPVSGTGVLEVYRASGVVIQRASYSSNATFARRSTDQGATWETWVDPALKLYTGLTQNETDFPLGHTVCVHTTLGNNYARNSSFGVRLSTSQTSEYVDAASGSAGSALAGTWRARGRVGTDSYFSQRTA